MDTLSKTQRSERMGRIRNKDTKPELIVRKILYGMGYRYRLHDLKLPGKPDVTFRKKRKLIFVHGCFWHRHSDSNCKFARLPKSRLEFWEHKLEANRKRDIANLQELLRLGWKVLIVWECQIKNSTALGSMLKGFLNDEFD